MRADPTDRRGPVYFSFRNPAGFSGQKTATETVMNGLEGRGWVCRRLPLPVLDRSTGAKGARLRYLLGVAKAWGRASRMLGSRDGRLCVNLGLTRVAFVTDAAPLLLGRIAFGRSRVVISLHGSLFMHWPAHSIEAGVFRLLLSQAGTVTVLGERQKARLVALGIPGSRLVVVVNTCDLEPASAGSLSAKHSRVTDPGRPVQLLYLSSLIDTKGYPEYLESLHRLATLGGPMIEAVMCGRLIASEYSDRFKDTAEAEAWICGKMAAINGSARVRVRWIKGAVGVEKAALFRDAEVFVLPTRYAVEAQPLVLLEAMASGCAIVTTQVGEIPTILDRDSAALLEVPSADELAAVLQALVGDPEERARLSRTAHARFVNGLGIEPHLDAWEAILCQPGPAKRDPR